MIPLLSSSNNHAEDQLTSYSQSLRNAHSRIQSLNSKHRAPACNAVEDACVVNGYILLRDHLDGLLRHHAARQRRDVVQFRSVRPFHFRNDSIEARYCFFVSRRPDEFLDSFNERIFASLRIRLRVGVSQKHDSKREEGVFDSEFLLTHGLDPGMFLCVFWIVDVAAAATTARPGDFLAPNQPNECSSFAKGFNLFAIDFFSFREPPFQKSDFANDFGEVVAGLGLVDVLELDIVCRLGLHVGQSAGER